MIFSTLRQTYLRLKKELKSRKRNPTTGQMLNYVTEIFQSI